MLGFLPNIYFIYFGGSLVVVAFGVGISQIHALVLRVFMIYGLVQWKVSVGVLSSIALVFGVWCVM